MQNHKNYVTVRVHTEELQQYCLEVVGLQPLFLAVAIAASLKSSRSII